MAQLIPSTIPVRVFEDHEARVSAVAVFSDKRRMVTCSYDTTLRLWDLTTGVVLKKMEGHHSRVRALAVSRDGQFIASGDTNGELFVWDGETGEPLTEAISAHTGWILSLDFSSDGKVLASGSTDSTTKLWNTSTWKLEGNAINCGTSVRCVRYFPAPHSYSREHLQLAIATEHNIQIYHAGYDDWDYNSYYAAYTSNLRNRNNYGYYGHYSDNSYNNPKTKADFSSSFQAQHKNTVPGLHNYSLAWTPDGYLLTGGDHQDPTIRKWYPNSSTWTQYNGPWSASASDDNHVRLLRFSDLRTIAVFKHSGEVNCVIFSADGRHILSGGVDKKISQWSASEDALPEDGSKDGLMKDQVLHRARSLL
ncbi:WD40-repeat-containing domain protein [Suillus paluster]|uniref:WD40-repeat-containing domain protein n=1 Tax=Suillus paluster TaxID=48578 RepID=UPI001B85B7C4|nr:WD40-repeat-containing domain protein [Suillus paluster]KAG1731643.1 WD40-repeat-containing domain protein [Suillus paluster]